VQPTGPWLQAMRTGDFDVVVEANCNSVVNPVLDTQKYLPREKFAANYGGYSDPEEVDIYERMLRETDFDKQRALMRQCETRIIDTEAREFPMLWWYRMIPERSFVRGGRSAPAISSTRICPTSGWMRDRRGSRHWRGAETNATGDTEHGSYSAEAIG